MLPFSQLLKDFGAVTNEIKQLQEQVPRIMGNVCVREIKMNFRNQSYFNGTEWKERTDATNRSYTINRRKGTESGPKAKPSRYKGSVYNAKAPLLIQTRNLYNAIKYKQEGRGVFIGVNSDLVIYAKKMNEGGPGTWGGKNKTMTPARQFMPKETDPLHPKLSKAIIKEYDRRIKYILSKLK